MTEEQKNEPMTEEQINEIGNAIHDCIKGISYRKGMYLLTANIIRVLNEAIKDNFWTREEAINIVGNFNDNIELFLVLCGYNQWKKKD